MRFFSLIHFRLELEMGMEFEIQKTANRGMVESVNINAYHCECVSGFSV